MANLLEQLTSQYDIAGVDTPPQLPVTDAAILATITEGALVVAAAGMVHRQQLADALGSLEDVGARVLGVVLNRLPHKPGDTYTYYDYSAAPQTHARGTETQREPAAPDLTRTRASRTASRRSSSRPAPVKATESKGTETGRVAVPVSSTSEDSS
jgi:polysaccharide biosynthesis transport protein